MEEHTVLEEKNDAKEIHIDPSVLKEKSDTYSSLTDTNNVPLFTDKYEETMTFVYAQQEAEERELQADIFLQRDITGKSEYELVQDQLFINTEVPVRKKEVIAENTDIGQTIAIAAIFLIIFFMVVSLIMEKKNKRRSEDAADNYIYD